MSDASKIKQAASLPAGSASNESAILLNSTDNTVNASNGTNFAPLNKFYVNYRQQLNAQLADESIFVANRACKVAAISEVHSTAGSDASAVNLQVTIDRGTTAVGVGANILTNNSGLGFNLKGTANTVQTATLSTAEVDEVQSITVDATGGTFTVTSPGGTSAAIAYNASAAAVKAAVGALSDIGTANLTVTGSGTAGSPYLLTYGVALKNLDITQLTADSGSLTGPSISIGTDVAGDGSTDEVQHLYLSGTAGGTFTITYAGQTTAAIAYNANAAAVQAALIALSNLDTGDIAVTGSGTSGSPFLLTFGGTLTHTNVAQVTATATGLTGVTHTATIATTVSNATSSLLLAAGDRLSVDYTGTLTAVAGVVVTVQLIEA